MWHLQNDGVRRFAINAGGDVRVGDPPPGQPGWRVGIRHPWRPDRVAGVATIQNGAIATSGAYERGPHIVDPRTGSAPRGVLTTTIVGPDLGLADADAYAYAYAYATVAYALGAGGPAWTAGLAGYEGLTILADQTVRAPQARRAVLSFTAMKATLRRASSPG